MVNELIQVFDGFFKYIGSIRDGKKHQKDLVNWLVHKKTLQEIGDDKTRESISQKIGNRKDLPENVWNSEEGKRFIKQVSIFLGNAIEKTELKVTDILSSTKMQSAEISPLDLCQFICGMIEKKIIDGNFHVEITPTNQFLICDKGIYSLLKELARIFHTDYQEFMDLEKFCQLGELEKVDALWFHPGFRVFKNLYLTKNEKIGCRNWSIEKSIRALAWELADKLDFYYWHFSEMREALKYLFPTKFGKTSVSTSRKGLNMVNLVPTTETKTNVQAQRQDYPNNPI